MSCVIALGADHGGFSLKEAVKQYLTEKGYTCQDFGTFSEHSVDYPDMAKAPCEAVLSGKCEKAILFCGTGVGISISANKIKGIRACCCSDAFSAKYTRLHNDANVLCLGGRVIGVGTACELADLFLTTPFEGGRHTARIEKISALEEM